MITYHPSVQIILVNSPATTNAIASAQDHSGVIFLAVICFVILIFFAGMAAHD